MNAIKRYSAVRQMVALLLSERGEEILSQIPSASKEIKTALFSTQGDLSLERMSDDMTELNTELRSYQRLRDAISLTSYDTMGTVNSKITAIQKRLQNLISYNAELYYNLYFIMNSTSQRTINSREVDGIVSENFASFKRWFNGSKVVKDEKPLLVYHGTGASNFSKFTFDIFPGAYFGENKDYSEWFRRMKAPSGDGMMYECYLRVLNPIDLTLFKVRKVTYEEFVGYIELKYGYVLELNTMLKSASKRRKGLWAWEYLRGAPSWLKTIRDEGIFDGFHFYENNPNDQKDGKDNVTPAWLVLSSNQVKSAIGNLTYSLESDDIRFEKGGEVDDISQSEFGMNYEQLGENEKEWVRDEQYKNGGHL